jgi:hypothetical protein
MKNVNLGKLSNKRLKPRTKNQSVSSAFLLNDNKSLIQTQQSKTAFYLNNDPTFSLSPPLHTTPTQKASGSSLFVS